VDQVVELLRRGNPAYGVGLQRLTRRRTLTHGHQSFPAGFICPSDSEPFTTLCGGPTPVSLIARPHGSRACEHLELGHTAQGLASTWSQRRAGRVFGSGAGLAHPPSALCPSPLGAAGVSIHPPQGSLRTVNPAAQLIRLVAESLCRDLTLQHSPPCPSWKLTQEGTRASAMLGDRTVWTAWMMFSGQVCWIWALVLSTRAVLRRSVF
jgi:hypothetical protein